MLDSKEGLAATTMTPVQELVFLDPYLQVSDKDLETIRGLESIGLEGWLAAADQQDMLPVMPADDLTELLRMSDQRAQLSIEQTKWLARYQRLTDAKAKSTDAFGAIIRRGEELGGSLAYRLQPGEHLIGQHWYSLAKGAYGKLWFSRLEQGTWRKLVFNRDDAIDNSEALVLGRAGMSEHIDLLLDVHQEHVENRRKIPAQEAGLMRLADQLETSGWPEKQIPLIHPYKSFSKQGSEEEQRYPWLSHRIAGESQKFYREYQDLLPDKGAALLQFEVDEAGDVHEFGHTALQNTENNKQDSESNEANAGKETQKPKRPVVDHVALALGIGSIHKHKDGRGGNNKTADGLKWQITRARPGEGRTISGFEIRGARIRPLPRCHFDVGGRLTKVDEPNLGEVEEIWQLITAVLDHRILAEKARELRSQPPFALSKDHPVIVAAAAMMQGLRMNPGFDEHERQDIDDLLAQIADEKKHGTNAQFKGEVFDLDAFSEKPKPPLKPVPDDLRFLGRICL